MVDLINQKCFVNKLEKNIMKFDKDKQKKILGVLERAWTVNLRDRSSRTMIADLITKELYGDDDGYLNNTAYGDKPVTVVAEAPAVEVKDESEKTPKVPKKLEKKVTEPVVSDKKTPIKKTKPKRRTKKNAISRP
tara:strand:+ start:177 stop:581 length:405 start_codon:yes stop_codon:yes gene_type:complete